MLHQKLISRVRMLLIISVVLSGIVVFNVLVRGADWLVASGLFAGGFFIGLYVFSRMSVIQWNEEQAIVEAGRMDAVGYTLIALYIAFEIGLRTFLKDFYPVSETAFILAAVAGTLSGRAFGTLVEVHHVFVRTHAGH